MKKRIISIKLLLVVMLLLACFPQLHLRLIV